MKTVQAVWIFDVDGVITNLREKKVTQPEILDKISEKLKLGEPIAINTGRPVSLVKTRIIDPLIKKISNKKIFQNLFIGGEKGSTWGEFDKQGNLIENKDNKISIPDNLKKEIRNLINNKYSDCMFYDELKLTMITAEMKDGYSIKDYKEKQKMLLIDIKALLKNMKLENIYNVDSGSVAVDIENKSIGKHLATRRILEWIKRRGFQSKKYIAIGDRFSLDLPMAQEINSQRLPVEFVYVGEEHIDTSKYPFPIIIPKAKFENGTLEFLKSIS